MELGEILEQIKTRWTRSKRYELIIKLDEAPDGAATGTEGMALTGGFLLRLKKTNGPAFNEIDDLVNEYIATCAIYGLTLRIKD